MTKNEMNSVIEYLEAAAGRNPKKLAVIDQRESRSSSARRRSTPSTKSCWNSQEALAPWLPENAKSQHLLWYSERRATCP